MFNLIQAWFKRYFSDPQAAVLLLMLVIICLVITLFGSVLAPLLAGLILAYLLDAVVSPLHRYCHLPRWLSVMLVFVVFIGLFVLFFIWLLPLLYRQLSQLIAEIPNAMARFQYFLHTLPEKYPLLSQYGVDEIITSVKTSFSSGKATDLTKAVFSFSINSLPSIVTWFVYVILVPLLALFFIKDKKNVINWAMQFAPRDRGLLVKVYYEMQKQLGNYVRGKALEVLIVWVATYIGMRVFNLNYASLLSFFVGLSVIIPYIGIVIATIPVVIVGIVQYGVDATFVYMISVYAIIQILDGFVLVPLLFSEVINLHPIAIIVSVVFFGSIWGFWGLFFAIPLATLVNVLISAWRQHAIGTGVKSDLRC